MAAQGILRGFDQATNMILDECHERVYSSKVQQLCDMWQQPDVQPVACGILLRLTAHSTGP